MTGARPCCASTLWAATRSPRGSSQKAIFEHLVSQPLGELGLRFADIDKYATELHNPEVTEPAGSGNVPLLNYRVIAGLAAMQKEIERSQVADFVAAHGYAGLFAHAGAYRLRHSVFGPRPGWADHGRVAAHPVFGQRQSVSRPHDADGRWPVVYTRAKSRS